eukprot:1478851-Pyramimonas_sp.AAC.1
MPWMEQTLRLRLRHCRCRALQPASQQRMGAVWPEGPQRGEGRGQGGEAKDAGGLRAAGAGIVGLLFENTIC